MLVALVDLYLGFQVFLIIKNWKTLIQRNKLIFLYSLGFVICLMGMLWGSAFNYYSNGGPALLLAVAISNLYVFMLVYLFTPTGKSNDDITKLARGYDVNQELENQYKSVPLPQEQELMRLQEERLEQQPRKKLRDIDDKPEGFDAPSQDDLDNTYEDYKDENKRSTGTAFDSRPTLSPQRPLVNTQAEEIKDDDPFTL